MWYTPWNYTHDEQVEFCALVIVGEMDKQLPAVQQWLESKEKWQLDCLFDHLAMGGSPNKRHLATFRR